MYAANVSKADAHSCMELEPDPLTSAWILHLGGFLTTSAEGFMA